MKKRLEKLEGIQKAKEDGTYVPKPWENRPLIQELYAFALKSHTTKGDRQRSESQSSSGDKDPLMDLGAFIDACIRLVF